MMIASCAHARCDNSESVGVFVRNLQQSTITPWTKPVAIEADLGSPPDGHNLASFRLRQEGQNRAGLQE